MSQTKFFVILGLFSLYPPDNPKPQKPDFEKLNKTPENIIILHMCTINDNHMIYIVHRIWSAMDRIFCHFGPFFALSPPNNPKNQNDEKMKKSPGDIIILHKCTINYKHVMYGS